MRTLSAILHKSQQSGEVLQDGVFSNACEIVI